MHAGAGQADTGPVTVLVTVMTSAVDGRTHAVTDPEFRAGVVRGRGIYRAMCGRYVLAASLGTPLGPACTHCAGNSCDW